MVNGHPTETEQGSAITVPSAEQAAAELRSLYN